MSKSWLQSFCPNYTSELLQLQKGLIAFIPFAYSNIQQLYTSYNYLH